MNRVLGYSKAWKNWQVCSFQLLMKNAYTQRLGLQIHIVAHAVGNWVEHPNPCKNMMCFRALALSRFSSIDKTYSCRWLYTSDQGFDYDGHTSYSSIHKKVVYSVVRTHKYRLKIY